MTQAASRLPVCSPQGARGAAPSALLILSELLFYPP